MHQTGEKNLSAHNQPETRARADADMGKNLQTDSSHTLAHTIITLIIVVVLASALVIAWEIILALFMAVLFGVFLNHTSRQLSEWTPLPYKASLAALVLLLICAFLGTTTFFFVQINQEIEEARQQIDEGINRIQNWAEEYTSISSVIHSTPILAQMLSSQKEKPNQDKAEQPSPAEKEQSGSIWVSGEEFAEQHPVTDTTRAAGHVVCRQHVQIHLWGRRQCSFNSVCRAVPGRLATNIP